MQQELTHGEGTEHLGQCIRKLLVTLIRLQIHFAKIWSPVHANLHKCCRFSHSILPIGSHWWPPHNLRPKINPNT